MDSSSLSFPHSKLLDRPTISQPQPSTPDSTMLDDGIRDAIPDNIPDNLDDLLEGLGSDDLNDFDGLDDDGPTGLAQTKEEDPYDRGKALNALFSALIMSVDWFRLDFGDGPQLPFDPTAPVSFLTAKGRPIPPPSKSALEKVQKLFADDTKEAPTTNAPRQLPPSPNAADQGDSKRPKVTFTTGTGGNLPPLSESALQVVSHLFQEEYVKADIREAEPPQMTGFSMASGRAAPKPSTESMKKAFKLFEDSSPKKEYQLPGSPSGGLQSGSGQAVPATSAERRLRAMAMFDDEPIEKLDYPLPKTSGFKLGSGRSVPQPNKDHLSKVMSLFSDSDPPQTSHSEPKQHTSKLPNSSNSRLMSTPNRPIKDIPRRSTQQLPTPFSAPRFHEAGPSTPTRTPLATTTNTFHATPKPKSIDIMKTPVAPLRRIGLGMTPGSNRSKGGKAGPKGFVTPFKKVQAFDNQPVFGSTVGGKEKAAELVVDDFYEPVFDLTKPKMRQTYRDAYLHPQYNSTAELAEMGLPDEIWQLNLANAVFYQFTAEDGPRLGSSLACEVLRLDNCQLVNQNWVNNHWSQILWKLAGTIQAKPELFWHTWTWGEVINQLKYRYEREYGAAQRPIVRRIQEHDSPSSSPMILCISAVYQPPITRDESGVPIIHKPFLELTDGWYRINAQVDDCLARAIRKGKLQVGRKLAVAGARLESAGEGSDVLEAIEKSHLIISANSTSLSKWDSRLGFSSQPFVTGLSHLSVDGGNIALMDIVVDKIYPLAFMSGDRAQRVPPWNEEEEQIKEDQWREKYANASSRLQDEMRKRLEKIEDLALTIASYAEEMAGPISSNPPDDIEDEFDAMLERNDATSTLRNLSSSRIVHLACYARDRMNSEMNERQLDIESELKTICPPRDVKDFRVIKFVDGRNGKKESMRVGMLNVWEARQLGSDSIQEGKRYLVANLIPARSGDWSLPKPVNGGVRPEIYLHTKKDTRWKVVA
ncbi:breast cancer 2 susceptibility protein, partial [Tremellales sp. Uapishka_1]